MSKTADAQYTSEQQEAIRKVRGERHIVFVGRGYVEWRDATGKVTEVEDDNR